MRKYFSIILSILLIFAISTETYAASDISKHWAKNDIEFLMKKNIVKGYKDNTYRPDENVTRIEFVIMVNRAMGFSKSSASINFKDVKSSNWYYGELKKGVTAGFISGYPDGNFRPHQPISRQEASAALHKAMGQKNSNYKLKFKDNGSIASWAKKSVAYMVDKGYISGYPDGNFRPKKNISRGESAKILAALVRGESKLPEKPGEKPQGPSQGAKFPGLELKTVKGKANLIVNKPKNSKHKIIKTDDKFIIDIFDSIYSKGYHDYKMSAGVIENVRASQLSTEGIYKNDDLVTRVVIDLKPGTKSGDYEYSESGSKITFISKANISEKPDEKPTEKPGKPSGRTIVIDPGHGGVDSGARGNGYLEKNINLAVSKKVDRLLKNRGHDVHMTRYDDTNPSYAERADCANSRNADLFLSIHTNSFTKPGPNGIETLYKNDYKSKALAECIQESVMKASDATNRGTVERPNLAVLRRTNMSAALIELGFISNKEESDRLNENSYQDLLAKAIVDGIENFIVKYLD